MANRGSAQDTTRRSPAVELMYPDLVIFLCFAVVISLLGVFALLYEFRRKRFEPEPTEERVVRCEDCAYVYTDDHDVDRSRCPECGLFNSPFVF